MSLVNRIKMLCAKQHISLHRLEMTIGFSKSSISKWDVNAPSVEKVLRVAEYFNVSMDFLLGRRSAASPTAFSWPFVGGRACAAFRISGFPPFPNQALAFFGLSPQPFCNEKKRPPFRAVFYFL